MRALVAGAIGFLGHHLCWTLDQQGWEVVGVDNYSTGSQNAAFARWPIINRDISKPLRLHEPFDAVFHFASPASPGDFDRLAVEIIEAGTLGTRNLLELAQEQKARFLLASTSEVYGDPLVHPQPETYWGNVNPIGPRSCYDEAKRCSEAYTMAFHRSRGVDTRIVRFFNVYGEGMRPDDGRLVPAFLQAARANQPLPIRGNGEQTRSLCYVSDAIDGVLRVFEQGDAQPYNIGNPEEVSILDLAHKVLLLTGRDPHQVTFSPLPPDDPQRRCPDISRLRGLGYEPQVDLDEGLRRTLGMWPRD